LTKISPPKQKNQIFKNEFRVGGLTCLSIFS
jgi:hypothetical protein